VVAEYDRTLITLQPGQEDTATWSHPVQAAGDYRLQFGAWRQRPYISANLLHALPSPSQVLIRGVAICPPTVETQTARDITTTAATLWGVITDTGGASIEQRTFCWSISPDASCNSNSTSNVTVSGNSFSVRLTGLQPNTTYHFRAWARNSAGWGHGTVLPFQTLAAAPPSIVSVTPSPSSTRPGGEVTLSYTVDNPGPTIQILLGASIRLPGGPTLSDPNNDRTVALAPGRTTVTRPFVVPSTAPLGTYDLLASLVQDINNNGRIDHGDRILDLRTFPGALRVVRFSIGDRVQVHNTGATGLRVRNLPCGPVIGRRFDGATGVILEGPVFCDGHNRWRIRWGNGLVGWSAEDWLRRH
jgi:hypothetical protein